MTANAADTAKLRRKLSREFHIKNIGKVRKYLGVNIMQLEHGRFLIDQEENIKEIVENIDLDDSKPTFTPMS